MKNIILLPKESTCSGLKFSVCFMIFDQEFVFLEQKQKSGRDLIPTQYIQCKYIFILNIEWKFIYIKLLKICFLYLSDCDLKAIKLTAIA